MEALISDLNEQSQICGQSLLVRSKPSPVRTWSLKWKRDSWTQLLSGRILKPSLGESFVESWTSSLEVIPANHSAQQESVSEQKIPDTSGPTLQMELLQCDQVSVSLKTSRDISRWGCPTLLKTWDAWVTERRGAYSLRLKSAHLTNEKGSSSWPTANARDWKDGDAACNQRAIDGGHQITLGRAATCWPTPCAMEAEKAGKFDKGQMGQSLSAMANRGELGLIEQVREQAWPTPIQGDAHLASTPEAAQRRIAEGKITLSRLAESGLAAPDNRSTHGSRPESWRTPSSSDGEGGVMEMRDGCAGKYKLRDHVAHWATPRAGATDNSRPNNKGGIPLGDQARREAWATPQASDHVEGARTGVESNQKCLGRDLNTLKTNGKLNPRWVETLMGLPIGWVMPSCTSPVTIEQTNSDSSETESCQQPQNSHGQLF